MEELATVEKVVAVEEVAAVKEVAAVEELAVVGDQISGLVPRGRRHLGQLVVLELLG